METSVFMAYILTYGRFISDVLEKYVEGLEELNTDVTATLLVHYLQEKR